MLAQTFLELIAKYTEDAAYSAKCWEEIEKAYTKKNRHYHNLSHLENMYQGFVAAKGLIKEPDTMLFALFYHDIVYKVTKSDNEHQSALFFKKQIIKTSFPRIEATMHQIEITKSHEITLDPDANLFLDLDLSILGHPWEAYLTYSRNIRKEYQRYPDFMYKKGRKKVLQHFLQANTIFKTLFFQDLYEDTARENLKRELELLR